MYAFFRFLAKIIQYPHSFSLMTFLYRSIHYQPTTQVIGRKFRVSSIQEYRMSARVQNRTTRILRLQNVICEPRCFACNAQYSYVTLTLIHSKTLSKSYLNVLRTANTTIHFEDSRENKNLMHEGQRDELKITKSCETHTGFGNGASFRCKQYFVTKSQQGLSRDSRRFVTCHLVVTIKICL